MLFIQAVRQKISQDGRLLKRQINRPERFSLTNEVDRPIYLSRQ